MSDGTTFGSTAFPFSIDGVNGSFVSMSSPSSLRNRVYLQTKFESSSKLNNSYYSLFAVDLFDKVFERMKITW
jgi:hypothetical protein